MRRPLFLRRPVPQTSPGPRQRPVVDRAEVAREIADALPVLIAKAKAADMAIAAYLLALARNDAERAARLPPCDDGDFG